jgi:AmiR/NasT family two-component response regulator
MVKHELGRNEAFDQLRGKARSQRRKVADLAKEVVTAQESLNSASALAGRSDDGQS